MNARAVSLAEVARTPEMRIEPHHFEMQALVQPYRKALKHRVPLTRPYVSSMGNGLNLPESAYLVEGAESEYLYASVGAISLYVFRQERAIGLKSPADHEYSLDLEAARATPEEVLVTRSGATGVAGSAWAAALADPELRIIPSGFVIRIACAPSLLDPRYLASILNHPLWRVWTNSLSAGKEQRNLSQEHLRDIRVPSVEADVQLRIAEDYLETLAAIAAILRERLGLLATCDEIIRAACGLEYPDFLVEPYWVAAVPLQQIAEAPGLRIDPRQHQQGVRRVVAALAGLPSKTLAALTDDIFKGRQFSTEVPEDNQADDARVVATVSVQAGQVVYDLTKPTRSELLVVAEAVGLRQDDVVITMDGEGSIGRAAVFELETPAAPDSHVGVLRLSEPALAPAVCCYLNSGLAQAQVELATSGSTGQTQLSKTDLASILVPSVVVERASAISAAFGQAVQSYEELGRHVRRVYCEHSARTSDALIEAGAFDGLSARAVSRFTDPAALLSLLDRVRETLL